MLIKNRQTKAALVIGDEWDPKHLNTRQISETKRMLEGRGYMYETKHCDPFIAFKDSYFLYASNNIHELLGKAPDQLSYTEKLDRDAINHTFEKIFSSGYNY